ncbi:hypothetical protein EGH21_11740 [Halomicroarcula sp. F13]|uniref:DUF2188 domain-containing protein n=1 Tax=Haloarcula rubra TaxID=2487747 RepID=A0AAW4PU65_9EURY|nr:hypothetical protein [Halomicroarcula rubra]MBX0323699.1 hypothetical protein [Halomicroarcula rubra]
MSISDGRRTESDGKRRLTTLVVEERDGEWVVTQGGVPVEGRGETAAAAATAYCRNVSEGVDGE